MGFLWLLIVIVAVVIQAYIASVFAGIAYEKGFGDEKKYFWLPFLFGIIGMLMVVALPDQSSADRIIRAIKDEKEKHSGGKNYSAKASVDAADELPTL